MVRASTDLPDAAVGLVSGGLGQVCQSVQQLPLVIDNGRSAAGEQTGAGQHLAVDVVLGLVVRSVADAPRFWMAGLYRLGAMDM